FGIFDSALFATVTTDASCGAVNSMHDSFTPLGGMVPLFNIQTGEVIFGGVGAGLHGRLLFVVLAFLAPGLSILCFTAWAVVTDWGKAGLNNQGPHGFSEILYAYTSCAGNNGSAFAGLTTNTPQYNNTLACDMLVGRF